MSKGFRPVSRPVHAHVRRTLLAAAALFGLNAYVETACAQAVIDGGATETVPGTHGTPWNVGGTLTVGSASNGTLTVSGGGEVDALVTTVGELATGTGIVTVTGTGSQLQVTGLLTVGLDGEGLLTVADAAQLSSDDAILGASANSHGVLVLTGANTKWNTTTGLTIGSSGHGEMRISDGAWLSGGFAILGMSTGSFGEVTVTGTDSIWFTSVLSVGAGSQGALQILNGAAVLSDSGSVGTSIGGSGDVLVSGPGSIWDITNTLDVGVNGTGVLSIADKGFVTSGQAVIAAGPASGVASVSGAHSHWSILGDLVVGGGGPDSNGSLHILDGGEINTRDNGYIAYQNDSTGYVRVSGAGSAWNIGGNQAFVGGDASNSGFGTLVLTDGGTLRVDDGAGFVNVAQMPNGYASDIQIGGELVVPGFNPPALPGYVNAAEVHLGPFGVVVFNHTSDSYVFAPVLTGSGAIEQLAGTTMLTGASGVFAGTTNVSGGTLLVEGVLGGLVNVKKDGTLGGSGNIDGAVSMLNGHAVLLGTSGRTLTMDSLSMDPTASISAQLGAPGGVSLFKVNGNLVLDGTLNVTNLGDFGAGVYRLFDYGTLTDNGLLVGSMPAGTSGVVQTSVDHEINFVVSGAVLPDMQFWNGSATAGSGSIKGGPGTWTAGTTTNWTDASGTSAAAWSGRFAVFQGTPGTISVDANAGAVSTTGMQFIGKDWRVGGDSLLLADPGGMTTVRVGDGTAAGASSMATIASPLTGTGGLIKDDLGTLVLEASNTYTGGTTVQAGTLAVNGALTGSVDVRTAGRLQGNGRIGGLAVAGTVAPGNSLGTLRVGGDVTFAAGSRYELEANAAGDSDRIAATGSATLAGGEVQVIAGKGSYAPSTTYTILTADAGVTGTFEGVSSNLALLTPVLSYDSKNVFLTLNRNGVDFRSVGVTPNQIATGSAVDGLGWGHGVYDAAIQLSAPEARAAFDQLSGEVHAASKSMLLEDSRFLREAGINRLRSAFDGVASSAAPVLTYNGKNQPQTAAADTESFATWAEAYGSWGSRDGDGNAARTDRSTGGIVLGADAFVIEDWRIGLLAGFSRADVDVDARSSSATHDNYHLGLYAGSQWGQLAFRSGAIRTWSDVTTDRFVAYPGFAEHARSDHDSDTVQGFGELGYGVRLAAIELEPYANVAYVNVRTGRFGETGGASALTASRSTLESTFGSMGVRIANRFTLGHAEVTARGALGWLHSFGDVVPHAVLGFENGNGVFSIAGAPLESDTAVVDAGLDVGLGHDSKMSIAYGGRFGSGVEDSALRVTFEMEF